MISPGKHTFFALGGVIIQALKKALLVGEMIMASDAMPYGCFSKLRTVHGMGNPTESYPSLVVLRVQKI